jgi:hypothetical protein
MFNNIKWFIQKVFRKSHISDIELWNLDYTLAKIIIPKLIEFKNMKRKGFPTTFSKYSSDYGISILEYKNSFIGGEMQKWNEYVDEMIFAFECLLYLDDRNEKGDVSKKHIIFCKKYGYNSPYRETEDNLRYMHSYANKNRITIISNESDLDKKKGYILKDKIEIYCDRKLLKEMNERMQNGFELFGKYFTGFWD